MPLLSIAVRVAVRVDVEPDVITRLRRQDEHSAGTEGDGAGQIALTIDRAAVVGDHEGTGDDRGQLDVVGGAAGIVTAHFTHAASGDAHGRCQRENPTTESSGVSTWICLNRAPMPPGAGSVDPDFRRDPLATMQAVPASASLSERIAR